MAKINLQFHSLPQELIAFIKECYEEDKIFAVALIYFPVFKILKIEDFESLNLVKRIDRICFSLSEVDTSSNNILNFYEENPDCLSFTIGKYNKTCLFESEVVANTNNLDALKIWRKYIDGLKAITLEGALVVSPYTGSREFYKNHRYTQSVKQIADEGVTIKAGSGDNYFILGCE